MSQKTLLASLIIASLGLTACDSDELPVKENDQFTSSRIQFSPSDGVLAVPNDILFLGTTDGTLVILDETDAIDALKRAASKAGKTVNYDDLDYTAPNIALGSLDGWSTTQPIVISIDLADGQLLDPASLNGSVTVLPVSLAGSLTTNPSVDACKPVTDPDKPKNDLTVCAIDPLDFGGADQVLNEGVDYFLKIIADGSTDGVAKIAINWMRPLPESTSFLYAFKNSLKDTSGKPVKGSTVYEYLQTVGSITDDPTTKTLQALTNHYNDVLGNVGLTRNQITYTAVFTTQSTNDVLETSKKMMLSGSPAYTPVASTSNITLLGTVASASASTQAVEPIATQARGTNLYSSSITVPYYLEDDNIKSYWKAAGDSMLTILGAVAQGGIDDATLTAACGVDIATASADPTKLVGCEVGAANPAVDFDPTNLLTRFNPLAAPVSQQTIPVQITLPDMSLYSAGKPAGGWPVNIAIHGLGTLKETTLMNAGAFAQQGIATIAIDMPLHGSRGYDSKPSDGVFDISATSSVFGAPFANGDVTNFVNINSGLTVRDNFRQAVSDHLALRMQIDAFKDTDGSQLFNPSEVSVHGLSLGAITASMFAAIANDSTYINFYGVNSVSLVAPAGGLAGVFYESPTFGPVLMDGLVKKVALGNGLTEAQANTIASDRASAQYQAFEMYAKENIVNDLLFSVQTQIEASDPINYGTMLSDNVDNIHLIEIIGDIAAGGTNPSDQVLPNQGTSGALVGTEPLVAAIGLDCIDASNSGSADKGVVRFEKGHHSSLIDPSNSGITGINATESYEATIEMQSQVATHALSTPNSIALNNGIALGTQLFLTCE